MPPACDHIIVALDALGNESRTFIFEFVKSRLIQEEQRVQAKDTARSSSDSSALLGVRTDEDRRQIRKIGSSVPIVIVLVVLQIYAGERRLRSYLVVLPQELSQKIVQLTVPERMKANIVLLKMTLFVSC